MRSAASPGKVLDGKYEVGDPETGEDDVGRCTPPFVGVDEGEDKTHAIEDKGNDGLTIFINALLEMVHVDGVDLQQLRGRRGGSFSPST